MLYRFRHIITGILLPFMLAYANGKAVVWCVYAWEWEDIVTHYCQSKSTEECDGKAYVNSVLDARDPHYPSLPATPLVVQDLTAILANNSTLPRCNEFAQQFHISCLALPASVLMPNVFHPPRRA